MFFFLHWCSEMNKLRRAYLRSRPDGGNKDFGCTVSTSTWFHAHEEGNARSSNFRPLSLRKNISWPSSSSSMPVLFHDPVGLYENAMHFALKNSWTFWSRKCCPECVLYCRVRRVMTHEQVITNDSLQEDNSCCQHDLIIEIECEEWL